MTRTSESVYISSALLELCLGVESVGLVLLKNKRIHS